MEDLYCQSCGMSLKAAEDYGTEKGGTACEDYRTYCYRDGAFTSDITMDEMIAFCAEHLGEWDADMTKETAVAMMKEYFPQLKRWK